MRLLCLLFFFSTTSGVELTPGQTLDLVRIILSRTNTQADSLCLLLLGDDPEETQIWIHTLQERRPFRIRNQDTKLKILTGNEPKQTPRPDVILALPSETEIPEFEGIIFATRIHHMELGAAFGIFMDKLKPRIYINEQQIDARKVQVDLSILQKAVSWND